jgi:hypothetical protein
VDAPLLLDVDETRKALGGLGRTKVYELANTGEITKINIGARGFFTTQSIAAYVERLALAATAGAA